ncbi:hypothetical protein AB5J49_44380 [Streptomyces sp. R28]|uniref:YD repeat-containing protein n=1 Tax=Streptomyces sp. R28 TaxID=3238628 RepID=A0AB39QAJ8_9ACTN
MFNTNEVRARPAVLSKCALLDSPVKITDNSQSTVTYTYDTAAEPQGPTTRATDSVAATRDSDGTLVYSDSVTSSASTYHYDAVGRLTEVGYRRSGRGLPDQRRHHRVLQHEGLPWRPRQPLFMVREAHPSAS